MHSMWKSHLSQSSEHFTSSVIRDLLRLTEKPSIISFAGGIPAPECFPTEEITAATEHVLVEHPMVALQYGLTEGYTPLRLLVAERMQRLNMSVAPEQVLMTSGSQQALDLLGMLFLDPGSLVAVENPTYLGALQAWQGHMPRYVTLPVDDAGMDVAALEQVLAGGAQPKFLYITSSYQNPTGVTLAAERRYRLVEVAAHYGLPIIEDDPYGELTYDGDRPVPLAAIDMELHGEQHCVIYVSSFSKILAPGLRVGWVAAPEELVTKLVQAKQGFDLHTGSLTQMIIAEVCQDGLLEEHIPLLRSVYRQRRDAMLTALEQHMPGEVHWTRPRGGMFVWLTLPVHIDTAVLFHSALEHEVAFVPGTSFHANGGGTNTLRLSFSLSTPDQIAEGIARLGRVVKEMV